MNKPVRYFRYKGKVAPNVLEGADPWISTIVKSILEGEVNVTIAAKRAGCSQGAIYGLISGKTRRPQRMILDQLLRVNGQRMAILPMNVAPPAAETMIARRYVYPWSPKDIIKTGNQKPAKTAHKRKGIDVARRRD